jgi:hypothetical protein
MRRLLGLAFLFLLVLPWIACRARIIVPVRPAAVVVRPAPAVVVVRPGPVILR